MPAWAQLGVLEAAGIATEAADIAFEAAGAGLKPYWVHPGAGEPTFYDHMAPGAEDTMIMEDDDEVSHRGWSSLSLLSTLVSLILAEWSPGRVEKPELLMWLDL